MNASEKLLRIFPTQCKKTKLVRTGYTLYIYINIIKNKLLLVGVISGVAEPIEKITSI